MDGVGLIDIESGPSHGDDCGHGNYQALWFMLVFIFLVNQASLNVTNGY